MNPVVSIIIPTYNRANLLERALRSVLSQIFRDFEIIVVDDASTDNTQRMLIKKFKQEIDIGLIKYIRNETNLERSRSRNKGMDLAKGEYIAFLDDDDLWLPDHLTLLVAYLDRMPDVGIVFSNYLILYEDGAVEIGRYIKSGNGAAYRDLCISRVLAHNSTHLFRREIYGKLEGFNNNIEFGEDREFFSRIAMNYNVGYISIVTACIYTHHGSYSSKKTLQEHAYIKEKVWKIIEENSRKYSYPLNNKLRADYYLFLCTSFLPNILKTREYLLKAIKTDYRLLIKMSTWKLLLPIILGKRFYLLLKKFKKTVY